MRLRRILIFFVVFLAILIAGTAMVVRSTGVSRALVTRVLERFLRTDFELEDASLDPATGTVRLLDFSIHDPRRAERRLVSAGSVELEVETNPLGEMGAVQRVRVDGLVLDLFLGEERRLDLREILRLPADESGTGLEQPFVEVRDAKVRLHLTESAEPLLFDQVRLDLAPQRDEAGRMTLRGSLRSPRGHVATVAGSADFERGEFRAVARLEDIAIGPEIARGFDENLRRYLERTALQGTARALSLWVEYPDHGEGGGNRLAAGLTLEAEGVSCSVPEFPYPLRNARANLSATTRGGGTVKAQIREENGGRSLEARVLLRRGLRSEPMLEAHVSAGGVAVDSDLTRALDAQPALAEIRRAFRPAGGNLDLELDLVRRPPGSIAIEGFDLLLHEVTASFEGFTAAPGARPVRFPYPAVFSGAVQMRGRRLALHGVTGTRKDGSRLTITGTVTNTGAEPAVDLDVSAAPIVFGEELREALDACFEGGGSVYDDYAPAGKAQVLTRLRTVAGSSPTAAPRVTVTIRPLEASASYRGFPYRLERLRGLVKIAPAGLVLDLQGVRSGAAVRIGGRFLWEDPLEAVSELWVRAGSVPLDDHLRKALATLDPGLEDLWDRIRPRGAADAWFSWWRRGDEAPGYDLHADLKGGTVLPRDFELALDRLEGVLLVEGSGDSVHAEVGPLRGRLPRGDETPPAAILLQGSVDRSPDGSRTVDLTTVVRDLHLDEDLARALDAAGAFDLETWRVLAPSGSVDVVAHHFRTPKDRELRTNLRVHLDGVRSAAAILPDEARDLRGELEIARSEARFEGLRGTIAGREVVCQKGSLSHRGGHTVLDVSIRAPRFPVDDRLARLMTGPMRELYLSRRFAGEIDVDALHMRYRFADQGPEFHVDFDGQIVARDLSMLLGTRIEEINGTWTIDSGRVTPSGGELRGRINDVSLRVHQHRAHGFHATFRADPTELVFERARLRLHGGEVRGEPPDGPAIRYGFAGGGSLGLRIAWQGVGLTEFLRAGGVVGSRLRGTLSGRLELDAALDQPVTRVRAQGGLRVRDARLGEVPMFSAIYTYLAPDKRLWFDGASVKVALRDGRLEISDLEMTSPLVTVKGRGSMAMDGYIDMVLAFPDLFGGSADWLLLPAFFRMLSSQVVRFHVYGYLRNPRARPRWLWQKAPGRFPIEPIPPPPRPRPLRR